MVRQTAYKFVIRMYFLYWMCSRVKSLIQFNHTHPINAAQNITNGTKSTNIQMKAFSIKEFGGMESMNFSNPFLSKMMCATADKKAHCCACDPFCMKFQTCCKDAFWKKWKPLDMEIYKEMLVETSKKYKKTACVQVVPIATYNHNKRYHMITSCTVSGSSGMTNGSSEVEEDIKGCVLQNTSSTQHLIPVIGSDGYLYRSKFCARCNSIFVYTIVNVTVECNKEDYHDDGNKEKIDIDRCTFEIEHDGGPSDSIIRECYHPTEKYNRECAAEKPKCKAENQNCAAENRKCAAGNRKCATESRLRDLCNAYWEPLENYANIHCYQLCNTNKTLPPPEPYDCQFRRLRPLTWSMILSFSEDSQMKMVTSHSRTGVIICNKGDIFSVFNKKCQPTKCLDNHRLVGANCVPIRVRNVEIENANFDKCLYKNHPITFLINRRVGSFLDVMLRRVRTSVTYRTQPNKTAYNPRRDILSRSDVLEDMLQWEKGNDSIIISPVHNPLVNAFHNLSFMNTFPGHKICHTIKEFSPDNITYMTNCGVQTNSQTYKHSEILMWISLDKKGFVRHTAYCEQYYLVSNCTIDILYNNETIIHTDGSITNRDDFGQVRTFPVGQYTPHKEGTAICTTYAQTLNHHSAHIPTLTMVETYVSYVGSSASIVSCVLILATYYSFKQLQNVPGLCTVALTANLLLGDAMFLLAGLLHNTDYNDVIVLCKTTAILMHFGLIKAHAWSLVIAYDIMMCFVTFNTCLNESKKRLKYYFLLTSSAAILIITTSAILDRFDIVVIGYGDDGVCIPHGFYGRLYFYIIPASVTFVLSLVMLVVTMVKIMRDNKSNREALQHQHGRRDMNIACLALKLVLVLGISEGIGFVQFRKTPNNTEEGSEKVAAIFALLYSVARSLRGVMLVLVYICQKDVIELYKEGLYRRIGRYNTHAQSTTGSDNTQKTHSRDNQGFDCTAFTN